MSRKEPEFQPGVLLHEVIVGAFRVSGRTFDGWCKENGITQADARNFTFGQSRGERGARELQRIIDGAGRDLVTMLYSQRLLEHATQFQKGAA